MGAILGMTSLWNVVKWGAFVCVGSAFALWFVLALDWFVHVRIPHARWQRSNSQSSIVRELTRLYRLKGRTSKGGEEPDDRRR